MNRQRTKPRFRPVVEDCEARQMLSTISPSTRGAMPAPQAPVLVKPAGVPILQQAAPGVGLSLLSTSSTRLKGNHTPGFWKAGSDSVAIFAVEFEGAFTKANADKAFAWGRDRVTNQKISLDSTTSAGTLRTTSKNHVLIGWYNVSRKEGGWLAATYDKSRSWSTPGYNPPWYRPWEKPRPPEFHTAHSLKYLTNGTSSPKSSENQFASTWTTRGYRITLTMKPVNSSGDIQATFTRPS